MSVLPELQTARGDNIPQRNRPVCNSTPLASDAAQRQLAEAKSIWAGQGSGIYSLQQCLEMADHSLDAGPFKQIRAVFDESNEHLLALAQESVKSNLEVPVFMLTAPDLTSGIFKSASDMFWKTNITSNSGLRFKSRS